MFSDEKTKHLHTTFLINLKWQNRRKNHWFKLIRMTNSQSDVIVNFILPLKDVMSSQRPPTSRSNNPSKKINCFLEGQRQSVSRVSNKKLLERIDLLSFLLLFTSRRCLSLSLSSVNVQKSTTHGESVPFVGFALCQVWVSLWNRRKVEYSEEDAEEFPLRLKEILRTCYWFIWNFPLDVSEECPIAELKLTLIKRSGRGNPENSTTTYICIYWSEVSKYEKLKRPKLVPRRDE